VFWLLTGASTGAQDNRSVGPAPPQEAQAGEKKSPVGATAQAGPHGFFHRENKWLFAGVAAARAADFASTKNFRRRGRDEILLTNDVVDNTPAFAAVQAGGVATSMGLAYLFHRTGHHKLERWVSILHISVTGFGAARNFMLESRRPPGPAP
jgi:hypothetical protein